jgi:hypothetical protein
VGCQVLLHSEHEDLPYLARVECLWEDPKTQEPMVTCRWFYRRADVPAKLFDKPYKSFRGKNWTIRKNSGRATEASVFACVSGEDGKEELGKIHRCASAHTPDMHTHGKETDGGKKDVGGRACQSSMSAIQFARLVVCRM